MPVLRETVAWRRPRKQRGPELTPDEAAHVRAVLAFLKRQRGTWAALARAMGIKLATLHYAAGKRGSVSAGVALRAARAAGVPLEDVLSGAWPKPGMCPYCGRG